MLATEATALVHGRPAAEQAAETARKTFEEGEIAETLPSTDIARAELEQGIGVLAAFVKSGAGEFEQRGSPSNQGRRTAGQRRGRHGRKNDLDDTRPDP